MNTKTINAGQMCFAPDYLLITKEQEDTFIGLLKKANASMYFTDGSFNGKDMSHIVNKRNYDRLKGLFDDAVARGAKVAMGGVFNEENLHLLIKYCKLH